MNIVKNGESSTSPSRDSPSIPQDQPRNGDVKADAHSTNATQSRLILPAWDAPPLHASHDMISLLNLGSLYNTYVRPFAAAVGDDGQGGSDDEGHAQPGNRAKKKPKVEKGYHHLLPDCIDPLPAGEQDTSSSLLPLLSDFGNPPSAPPAMTEGRLEVLPSEAYRSARLEPGTQEGYRGGEKTGVKEAEARRRRRREMRRAQSLSMSMGGEGMSLPSPAVPTFDHPTPSSPGIPPLPPSQYGQRPYMPHAHTAGPGTPRGGGVPRGGTPRGGMPGRGGHHPNKRPFEGTPGGGAPKRGRGTGYRTGSEAPRGRGRPNVAQGHRSKTDF